MLQGQHQPRNPKGDPICRNCEDRYAELINTLPKLRAEVHNGSVKKLAIAALEAVKLMTPFANTDSDQMIDRLCHVSKHFLNNGKIVTLNVIAEAMSRHRSLHWQMLAAQEAQATLAVLFGSDEVGTLWATFANNPGGRRAVMMHWCDCEGLHPWAEKSASDA